MRGTKLKEMFHEGSSEAYGWQDRFFADDMGVGQQAVPVALPPASGLAPLLRIRIPPIQNYISPSRCTLESAALALYKSGPSPLIDCFIITQQSDISTTNS